MIIRATNKLLNTSGIKPVKNLDEIQSALPGEWYAGLVSLNRPGKLAIHFLHNPTKITVICPGKSLNKALPDFPARVEQLLKRLGFSKLVFQFQLRTEPEIYATDSRSMLSYMNQLRYNLEYNLAMPETIEDINYEKIEDIHNDWLFTSKGPRKYEKPIELLRTLVK